MHSHWPDSERHHRNYIIHRLTFYGCVTRMEAPVAPIQEFDEEATCKARQQLDEYTTGDLEQLIAQLYREYQQASLCKL